MTPPRRAGTVPVAYSNNDHQNVTHYKEVKFRLDKKCGTSLQSSSSGVPVALTGKKGIRCGSLFSDSELNPELRPQL
jgi:hypothetical protein